MADGFDSKVHIQVRPVEMPWRRLLNVQDLAHRDFLEPRVAFVGKKQLSVSGQEPNAVLRDIRHLNFQSAFPRRF